jgi:hypothetical protein
MSHLEDELLDRMGEASTLALQIARAVRELAERHGDGSKPATNARALQNSVARLRRELLQSYLECRTAGRRASRADPH